MAKDIFWVAWLALWPSSCSTVRRSWSSAAKPSTYPANSFVQSVRIHPILVLMVDGLLRESILHVKGCGEMDYWLTVLAINSKVPGIPPKDDSLQSYSWR